MGKSASTEHLAASHTAPSLQMKRSRSVNRDALASELCLEFAEEGLHKVHVFPESAWSLSAKSRHSRLSTGLSDGIGAAPCLNISTTGVDTTLPVLLNTGSRVSVIRLDAD